MPDNGEGARHYQDAITAQLGERVTNMGRRINDVEVEMRAGFSQLGSSLSASTNETRQSIAALSSTMAERNRPQYQALGFGLTVILAVGTLAYWPIRESTSDLKVSSAATTQSIQMLATETNKSIQALAAATVSRQEMDWRAARGAEDRTRMETAVTDLRSSTVTRAEWLERSAAINAQSAEANRRIDEIRQEIGAVYGTRDVIQDMKKEIDNLRQRVTTLRAGAPTP